MQVMAGLTADSLPGGEALECRHLPTASGHVAAQARRSGLRVGPDAHLGGDLPTLQQECSEEMARRRLPNAYLGTESIREYYSLRIALDRLGPEKILFGSDFPLGWPAAYLQVFEGTRPTPEGPTPLRVEIRREGRGEAHDYFVPAGRGDEQRYLELRYEPVE